MSMQQYENYKDTGNTWLGSVPSSWEVRRADFVIKSRKFQVGPSDLEDVDVYHYAIPTVQSTGAGAIEEGESIDSGKLIINEPQVLVSKLNPRKATVTIADPHAEYLTVASTEFVPLIPYDADLRYIFYAWKSEKVTKRLSSFVQSVTRSHQRCDPADITKIPWAWPSLNEQQKIAAFLDRKTAEIDALVDKKRRLLDRLAEKRTALITRAVTKGLNPDAPMKDSGIEWLGEIPAHWDLPLLRYVADVRGGVTKGRKLPDLETIEVPYLRVANVQDGFLNLTDMKYIEILASELPLYSLKVGDVLMNEGGDNDKLGRGAVWKGEIEPCLHQNHVFAVRPRISALSEWLALMTQSKYGKHYFWTTAKQSTNLASISSSNIKKLPVILPPEPERSEITEYVHRALNLFRLQDEKIRLAIEKLQEYRSALITNAVTGQIKVS
ncbi:MAG: type I restriction enzyme S subunit [Alloalcanivorax sp.]|jgi:type I restriction enzyme S subunit